MEQEDRNEIARILRDHTCYSPQAKAYIIHGGIEALIKWRDKFVQEWNWVKVEDGLPEINVAVLVYIPEEDDHVTTGMWDTSNSEGKWVLLDEYRVPDCPVTHWMKHPPLPRDNSNPITNK